MQGTPAFLRVTFQLFLHHLVSEFYNILVIGVIYIIHLVKSTYTSQHLDLLGLLNFRDKYEKNLMSELPVDWNKVVVSYTFFLCKPLKNQYACPPSRLICISTP